MGEALINAMPLDEQRSMKPDESSDVSLRE